MIEIKKYPIKFLKRYILGEKEIYSDLILKNSFLRYNFKKSRRNNEYYKYL